MLRKLKRNKKKGFTLVELIVVLVILAILAALLIPALTGYIDKAKEKQIIAQTRQAVMAAQTLVDEKYAAKTDNDKITVGETGDVTYDNVKKLAEITGTLSNVETLASGAIKTLTYTDGGKTCTYDVDAAEKYKVN